MLQTLPTPTVWRFQPKPKDSSIEKSISSVSEPEV